MRVERRQSPPSAAGWRRLRLRPAAAEDGFSVVESIIALGIIFAVLLGLLSTMTTSIKAVVTGRQRNVAVGLADDVMERARGTDYAAVGHNLTDATLGTNPALGKNAAGAWVHDPGTGTAEPLAGSSVTCVNNSGAALNPLPANCWPFTPHRWQRQVEGTTYTVFAYVTTVTPASGESFKRVTAHVIWDLAQYSGAVVPEVRVSSYIYPAAQPPDPLLRATSDTVAGNVSVSGFIKNLDLSAAHVWLATSHGEIDSRQVRRTSGFASSARTQLTLNTVVAADDLSGCSVLAGNKVAECPSIKVESLADNDPATPAAENLVVGPQYDVAGTVKHKQDVLGIIRGVSQEMVTASSARSCLTCGFLTPVVPDDTGFPYGQSYAKGPVSLSIPFIGRTGLSLVSGSLYTANSAAQAHSIVDVDGETSGAARDVVGTARAQFPAVELMTIDQQLTNLLGLPLSNISPGGALVRISGGQASATAGAGHSYLTAPTVTGDTLAVEIFDPGLLTPNYRTLASFKPGQAVSASASINATVAGLGLVLDVTVQSRAGSTEHRTDAGLHTTKASASLTSWFTVRTTLRIGSASDPLVNLTTEVDYGTLVAGAEYEAAP